MNRIAGLLTTGCSLALCVTQAWAADFYVQPLQPGPVAGAPLGAVALQGTIIGTSEEETDTQTSTVTFKRLRTTVNERGNSAGKWLTTATATEEGDGTTTTTLSEPTGETVTTTEAPVGSGGETLTTTDGTTGTAAVTTTDGTTATTTDTAPITTVSTSGGQTWNSVADVFNSDKLQPGDRILLMGGYHGPLSIRGVKLAGPITIAPVPGQVAHVDSITIRSSGNINIQDLKVWASALTSSKTFLIRTYSDTSNIVFDRMDVRAAADSGNYAQWPESAWLNKMWSGFMTDGNAITVRNSRITGIYHGIMAMGPNNVVDSNIVDGFGGDGLRALGDYSVVRNNRVQNCYAFDGNHDDGFQAFTVSPTGQAGAGTQYGLKLIGNKIFEWTLATPSPLRCSLQGIGMFDGMFEDLLIENNLIAVSHYHGITVTGTRKAVIRNNTVVNIDGKTGKYPWIRIDNDKDGTLSTDITLANNLAMSLMPLPKTATNSVSTNNKVIALGSDFVSLANKDYSLSATSLAVDGALAKYAPAVDILNAARPKGKAPDIGAYETR